jgi:hypothetical protein
LRRWIDAYDRAVSVDEERLEQMRLAMEARGVDHLVWTCRGCPHHPKHGCHMWDLPA